MFNTMQHFGQAIGRLALALTALPAMAATDGPGTVERHVVLMGTHVRIMVEAPTRTAALEASSRIEELLEEAEADLSTWRATSELAELNRTPVGEQADLSAEVSAELREALKCAEVTAGAFDPTIGVLVGAWDLRGFGRQPSAEEIAQAKTRVGYGRLASDGAQGWRRSSDVHVEEGGFGKGAALDRVGSWLRRSGVSRALVDLGGQLLLFEAHYEEDSSRGWAVEVASPDHRDTTLMELDVSDGSVATSANTVRADQPDMAAFGHLLDPRSGYPAADFGSLTVWSRSALWADCLATGLFVAGPEVALEYAAKDPNVEVLVIERDGDSYRARWSARFEGKVRRVAEVGVRTIESSSDSRTRECVENEEGNSFAYSRWTLGERVTHEPSAMPNEQLETTSENQNS